MLKRKQVQVTCLDGIRGKVDLPAEELNIFYNFPQLAVIP